ncbi:hypothetical protein DB346_24540 [Verrucomicrobia bacterium LW23]|nr:hypothetical protein DB346_24540 [Verrucomicrobia bacterium LW23]
MFKSTLLSLAGLVVLGATLVGAAPDSGESKARRTQTFPWKLDIVTTTFWIGQGSSGYNSTTNYKSAWDGSWTQNYGGEDNPEKRSGLLPKNFAATLNPFYCALPFNDVKYPELARRYIPWYRTPREGERYVSQCKGKWVQIRMRSTGKVAYAQWEDVGPFRYDHADYVFGNSRPTTEHSGAGLDVSPAVRDYLGMKGLDRCDWRFVDETAVPDGPWLKYGEHALIMRALKNQVSNKSGSSLKLMLPKTQTQPSDAGTTGVGTGKKVANDKM